MRGGCELPPFDIESVQRPRQGLGRTKILQYGDTTLPQRTGSVYCDYEMELPPFNLSLVSPSYSHLRTDSLPAPVSPPRAVATTTHTTTAFETTGPRRGRSPMSSTTGRKHVLETGSGTSGHQMHKAIDTGDLALPPFVVPRTLKQIDLTSSCNLRHSVTQKAENAHRNRRDTTNLSRSTASIQTPHIRPSLSGTVCHQVNAAPTTAIPQTNQVPSTRPHHPSTHNFSKHTNAHHPSSALRNEEPHHKHNECMEITCNTTTSHKPPIKRGHNSSGMLPDMSSSGNSPQATAKSPRAVDCVNIPTVKTDVDHKPSPEIAPPATNSNNSTSQICIKSPVTSPLLPRPASSGQAHSVEATHSSKPVTAAPFVTPVLPPPPDKNNTQTLGEGPVIARGASSLGAVMIVTGICAELNEIINAIHNLMLYLHKHARNDYLYDIPDPPPSTSSVKRQSHSLKTLMRNLPPLEKVCCTVLELITAFPASLVPPAFADFLDTHIPCAFIPRAFFPLLDPGPRALWFNILSHCKYLAQYRNMEPIYKAFAHAITKTASQKWAHLEAYQLHCKLCKLMEGPFDGNSLEAVICTDSAFLVFQGLCSAQASKPEGLVALSKCFLHLCWKHGNANALLQLVTEQDITSSSSVMRVMLPNSVAALLIKEFIEMTCTEYLHSIFQPLVDDVYSNHLSLEIDQEVIASEHESLSEEKLEKLLKSNQQDFLVFCQKALDCIINSYNNCPMEIRGLMRHIRSYKSKIKLNMERHATELGKILTLLGSGNSPMEARFIFLQKWLSSATPAIATFVENLTGCEDSSSSEHQFDCTSDLDVLLQMLQSNSNVVLALKANFTRALDKIKLALEVGSENLEEDKTKF
ncbi:hypothetical protein Pelo_305 [Pelomyxa schiedti]|nr:hypothetical protein Pelo_305 [Pelomyxa schiedti]